MAEPLRESLSNELIRWFRQEQEKGVRRVYLDADRVASARESFVARPAPGPTAAELLRKLDEDEVRSCTACALHEGRTQTVFGVGDPTADLVFVGEAPGAEEDRQGEPFVGPAGQLLDQIIGAIGFSRESVFILNTVKCRPPGNRDPEAVEKQACRGFLERQLEILQPKVICALGRHAAQTLLNSEESLGRMRQKRHEFGGIPVVVTYHPAALLRNPDWKRPAWEDVQALRDLYFELGGKAG